jgi:hypothetical protein
LVYTNGEDYTEVNIGTTALYNLINVTGSNKFNESLLKFISITIGRQITFSDFYYQVLQTVIVNKDEKIKKYL